MPLDLIPIEPRRQVLAPGDKGFLISLAKSKWSKQIGSEVVKLLKTFAQQYYEKKCPDEKVQHNGISETEECSKKNSKKQNSGERERDRDNICGIQFIQRDLVYNNCGFVASNLADPADYVHFLLSRLAEEKTALPKTSKAFRIMPVEAVCEAKPKSVEKEVLPLIEKKLGLTSDPLRFSLIYRGHSTVSTLSQPEAKSVIRNCIWAVNPNCVQCIKYQDFAVLMHMLSPLFLVGVVDDFQRLGGYNTWTIRQGFDYKDLGEDSEDEISDDPELEEDDEKKRKLRIKRKRRAEKAGLSHLDGDAKRSAERDKDDDDDEDDDGQDDDQGGDDHHDHDEDHVEESHDDNVLNEEEDNDDEDHAQ